MSLYYGLSSPGEEAALIDFINLVFSHDHRPHDFPTLLPKLYRPENFRPEHHYVAREDGHVRALVGAYPVELRVLNETLRVRTVGAVSVHPYARRNGHMRRLMQSALEDMRRDNVDLSCLGGQRQRYQYFGYERAGVQTRFVVEPANLRHVLGPDAAAPYTFRQVGPADAETLAAMRALHDRQPLFALRPEGLFYDALCSWDCTPYAVLEHGVFRGYCTAVRNREALCELVLDGEERLYPFLSAWFSAFAPNRLQLCVPVYQTERLAALYRLSEDYSVEQVEQCRIFCFARVLRAFFGLKASYAALADGAWTLAIADGERLRLTVAGGVPAVEPLPADAPCALTLPPLEATALLFSTAGYTMGYALPPHVQSWLPLPLFLPNQDGA